MNKSEFFNFFQLHTLAEGEELNLQLLDNNLKLRKIKNSLLVTHQIADRDRDLTKKVLTLASDGADFIVTPSLPELPILFKLEPDLVIKPRATLEINVPIPICIAIIHGTNNAKPLCEFPSRFLKKSWYGEFEFGEIVYFSKYSFESNSLESLSPLTATCAVRVRNLTEHELELKKLCVQTEYLGLYGSNLSFATTPISIYYKGGANASEIKVKHKMPKGYTAQDLIFSARTELRGGPRLRSLGRFFEFTGLKFLVE